MFCCTLLYVHSSFAIILLGKTELVAFLKLSSRCLLMVVWLPWVCPRFVIVVFPDHSHLLFFIFCTIPTVLIMKYNFTCILSMCFDKTCFHLIFEKKDICTMQISFVKNDTFHNSI